MLHEKLYNNQEVLQAEIKGEAIMMKLLDEFTKAVLTLDLDKEPNTGERNFYCHEKEYKKHYFHEYKVYHLISSNFTEVFLDEYDHCKDEKEKIYYKLRLAVDYVSGMTDSYALECYQILTGIK